GGAQTDHAIPTRPASSHTMRGDDSGSMRSGPAAPLAATGLDHVVPWSAERENHTRQPELSPASQQRSTSCFAGPQTTSGPSASGASARGATSVSTVEGRVAQPESGTWSAAHASQAARAAKRRGAPGGLAGAVFAAGMDA